jgi:hypothetical protein
MDWYCPCNTDRKSIKQKSEKSLNEKSLNNNIYYLEERAAPSEGHSMGRTLL